MPPSVKIISVGWPGDLPGFGCILELIGQAIHVRKEFEGQTLDDLIRLCMAEIQAPGAGIRGIIGRNEKAAMRFIRTWNSDEKMPFIDFGVAPNVEKQTGKIHYHIQALYKMLDPDRKALFYTDETAPRLKEYLNAVPDKGLHTITDMEMPAVAALGYGCTFLDQYRLFNESMKGRINTDNNAHRSKVTGY